MSTKILTNREWLESLTDEEFAKFIRFANCSNSCAYGENNTHCYEKGACAQGRVKWLKQPHKEANDDKH